MILQNLSPRRGDTPDNDDTPRHEPVGSASTEMSDRKSEKGPQKGSMTAKQVEGWLESRELQPPK